MKRMLKYGTMIEVRARGSALSASPGSYTMPLLPLVQNCSYLPGICRLFAVEHTALVALVALVPCV